MLKGELVTYCYLSWLFVDQMVVEEGVPCYKGWEDNYLVLRVPFRKNGSGMHLNQYTVSMHVKVRKVAVQGSGISNEP